MTVFDDFLTLSLCAFGMGRYEEEYLETLKPYSKEDINLFPHLLGALVEYYTKKSLKNGWVDGLGEFFEEHNGKFGRSLMGQFFTPPHLCNLMAMTSNDINGNINDPAAGSGRCLIALDRMNPNNRYKNFYTAMDIDKRCVKMCTLNMMLYGMKGVIIHMDSITQTIWGGYRVYLPETGLGVMKLNKNECFSFCHESPTPHETPQPIAEKQKQLRLFEILAQ